MESARSTKESLDNLTPFESLAHVAWMFGDVGQTYNPFTIPRTIFGGSSAPVNIIGIAHLDIDPDHELSPEKAKGGDVVSEVLDKWSLSRSDSCVSREGRTDPGWCKLDGRAVNHKFTLSNRYSFATWGTSSQYSLIEYAQTGTIHVGPTGWEANIIAGMGSDIIRFSFRKIPWKHPWL